MTREAGAGRTVEKLCLRRIAVFAVLPRDEFRQGAPLRTPRFRSVRSPSNGNLAGVKLALCREPEMLGGVWYTTASCPHFPLHFEDELELNLIVNGDTVVHADGANHRATRGDMVWLRPGYLHGLLERSSDLVLWVVSARAAAVELAARVEPNIGKGHPAEVVTLGRDVFARLSARCLTALRAQSDVRRFNEQLVQFLVDASTVPSRVGARPEEPHRAVLRTATMLEAPRDPRWTLFELAKHAGLSPYELSRLFRKQLGVPLVHYANHQRVQLFGRLYAERPTATILRNALDAGFGSYSQFFRIFRAVTHLSPDKFRELCEDGTLPNPVEDAAREYT